MIIEYNGIEVVIKPSNLQEDDPTVMYCLVKEVAGVVKELYNLNNTVKKATLTTKHFTMEYFHKDKIYVHILDQHTRVDTLHF